METNDIQPERNASPAGRPLTPAKKIDLPECLPEYGDDSYPFFKLAVIPRNVSLRRLIEAFEERARPDYGEVQVGSFFGGAERVGMSKNLDFYMGVFQVGREQSALEIYSSSDATGERIIGIARELIIEHTPRYQPPRESSS